MRELTQSQITAVSGAQWEEGVIALVILAGLFTLGYCQEPKSALQEEPQVVVYQRYWSLYELLGFGGCHC